MECLTISKEDRAKMSDRELLNRLLDVQEALTRRVDSHEERLSHLETNIISMIKGSSGEILKSDGDENLETTVGRNSRIISNHVDRLEYLENLLEAIVETNSRNITEIENRFDEMRRNFDNAKISIATLTEQTVAKESFERDLESRIVTLWNIDGRELRKSKVSSNSLGETADTYARTLAKSVLKNFDNDDISSVDILPSKSDGKLSIMIKFSSVGDAQKFKHRLMLRKRGQTSSGFNYRNFSASPREGLTSLQRSLKSKTISAMNDPSKTGAARNNTKRILRDGFKIIEVSTVEGAREKSRRIDNPLVDWKSVTTPTQWIPPTFLGINLPGKSSENEPPEN